MGQKAEEPLYKRVTGGPISQNHLWDRNLGNPLSMRVTGGPISTWDLWANMGHF